MPPRRLRQSRYSTLTGSRCASAAFALSELDLQVDDREIVSVIGPNGAGKTTLFNLITGVYEPTRATSVRRAAIAGQAPHAIARRDRAHVPDAAAVPEHDGEGERDGGGLLPHQAIAGGSILRLPQGQARGARDRALAEDGSRSSASG